MISKQRLPQVDAVVLDLGNVLVFHDNELLFRSLVACGSSRSDVNMPLVPTPMWSAIHRGELDAEGIRREVCLALGVSLTRARFDELWNSHFTPHDAVLPLVESLVGRVKLLLLSNTNAIHIEYLTQKLPILRRFDHLVLSHEVGALKPDPRIYREALRRAGTTPSRTAFFDDIPEYVEAAKGLGIRAYVFRSPEEFALQLAELGL